MKDLSVKGLFWVILFISTGFLTACNDSENGSTEETDTATRGNIHISVDDAFAPIIDSQISTFQGIYKYATINAAYKSEGEVIKDLLDKNNKIRLAITTRTLTPDEEKIFEEQKLTPRTLKIAIDGIAIIVNNSNPDTVLTLEELRKVFAGEVQSWKQINPNSPLDSITIVFDNNNSSSARYIQDSLTNNAPLPANTFASQSHPALIDYVAENKNAIGVIGVSWISDSDDKQVQAFRKKIKVVATGHNVDKQNSDTYFKPYQGYLATGQYPLRRNVYSIKREARVGLGTGFESFVAGDKGQRIILKSGLVPATMPVRVVGFNN